MCDVDFTWRGLWKVAYVDQRQCRGMDSQIAATPKTFLHALC